VFFSEEKNEKTFNFALADACRPWPDSWKWWNRKSLLVLFCRKEHAFSSSPAQLDH
jgi:hypothetical protein